MGCVVFLRFDRVIYFRCLEPLCFRCDGIKIGLKRLARAIKIGFRPNRLLPRHFFPPYEAGPNSCQHINDCVIGSPEIPDEGKYHLRARSERKWANDVGGRRRRGREKKSWKAKSEMDEYPFRNVISISTLNSWPDIILRSGCLDRRPWKSNHNLM